MNWMKDFQEFMTEEKVDLDFGNGIVQGNVVFARDDDSDYGLTVIGFYDEDDEFQDDHGQIDIDGLVDLVDFKTGEGITPIK